MFATAAKSLSRTVFYSKAEMTFAVSLVTVLATLVAIAVSAPAAAFVNSLATGIPTFVALATLSLTSLFGLAAKRNDWLV